MIWMAAYRYADTANTENREMAPFPVITAENYTNIAGQFESYINDRLPFRKALINMNSMIDLEVFRKSSNPVVAIGSDNWLFYDAYSDGDPMGHYRGEYLLSEEELEQIAQNCIKNRDILAADSTEFVIMIIPNKERVYFEYLPSKYGKPAPDYRTLQVVNYLKENTDLRVIYVYEDLMQARQELKEDIYYRTDTHWNDLGAYVGTTALMKELGVSLPDITSEKVHIIEQEPEGGDLAGMINLVKELGKYDHKYQVEGFEDHNVINEEWDFNQMFRYRAQDADPRKLYVNRDSFGTAMAPYIAAGFNESCMRHRNTYTYQDYLAEDPDIYVFETVERRIYELFSLDVLAED